MRCIIYSPHWLRTIPLFVVKSAFYILTLAWGFGVARFDLSGNAKAFLSWNEQQDWLHVFIYIN